MEYRLPANAALALSPGVTALISPGSFPKVVAQGTRLEMTLILDAGAQDGEAALVLVSADMPDSSGFGRIDNSHQNCGECGSTALLTLDVVADRLALSVPSAVVSGTRSR